MLYLLGDMEGASHEVKHLAKFFADRQNACRTDWSVERLRLSELRI